MEVLSLYSFSAPSLGYVLKRLLLLVISFRKPFGCTIIVFPPLLGAMQKTLYKEEHLTQIFSRVHLNFQHPHMWGQIGGTKIKFIVYFVFFLLQRLLQGVISCGTWISSPRRPSWEWVKLSPFRINLP